MTILRQGRWLQGSFLFGSASLLSAAAVLGLGLLVPHAAGAAPHTHGRRPLPTAMHATTVSDTGARTGAKRSKASAKGKAGTRSAGASAETPAPLRKGGKKGSSRRRKAEPVDDPVIPMYRAGRGQHSQTGVVVAGRSGGTRHGSFSNGPAPLVSSLRHGARSSSSARVVAANVPVMRYRSSGHPLPPAHDEPRHAATAYAATASRKPANPAANRSESFAEGVSHPDGDEPLARTRGAATDDHADTAGTAAPIVRASAAPPVPAVQPTVVQGFGGEIAVPSTSGADRSDRPGGTRRRNHPSTWTPESLVTQPEPLEEREAVTQAAVSPAVIPEIYDRNGRLLMPAPLKGSHDVLVHQNLMASSDGLERIQDDADLDRLRAAHFLVSFPVGESLRLNEDLPLNRRVARPWAVLFAADMAHGFYARFRQPLQVNSAVRTVHYQAHLQMVNGNAAATYGEAASPHLTGQAIDIGKRGMSQAELAWMRDYLMPLMQAGKIDVEEEFQQACFHISVYRSYAAGRPAIRHEVAQVHPVAPAAAGAAAAEIPDNQ